MTYEPKAGDDIRFMLATPFQRKYTYRVESVADDNINVSVTTGLFEDDPRGDRFYYDLEPALFRSLGPRLAGDVQSELARDTAIPLREDLRDSLSRQRRIQAESDAR